MFCGMLLDNKIINMNNITNKFLLTGDKFMPEMHLRQSQFVYSACGPFTRQKERIKNFKRTGDTCLLYTIELDWHRGVVVITAAKLHSTKPELRFCASSNPARGVSEIRDGEDF